MFHRFRASADAGDAQGSLTPEEFEMILLDVGLKNILSPAEWMERLDNGGLQYRHVCITFDDGLKCQADYALPILQKFDLRAFWFIYSCVFEGQPVRGEIYSHVLGRIGALSSLLGEFTKRCPPSMLALLRTPEFDGYAARMHEGAPFYSAEDIEYRFLRNRADQRACFEQLMDTILREHGFDLDELARQLWMTNADLEMLTKAEHHVGLHSYDHPYVIADLTLEEQRVQYGRNFAHIAAVTGRAPQAVSHPLNSYNQDSLAVLQELGIRVGFRANLSPAPRGGVNTGPLELAREDAADLLAMVRSTDQPQTQ